MIIYLTESAEFCGLVKGHKRLEKVDKIGQHGLLIMPIILNNVSGENKVNNWHLRLLNNQGKVGF